MIEAMIRDHFTSALAGFLEMMLALSYTKGHVDQEPWQ